MKPASRQSTAGYTMIEIIVVVVIIGILSAIVGPSWLGFLTRQRLSSAQGQALTVMRDAQVNAKRDKRIWEVCFRQNSDNNSVQYSVHPMRTGGAADCANASWQNLTGEANKIGILPQGAALPYKVQFDYTGLIVDNQRVPNSNRLAPVPTLPDGSTEIGRITFASRSGNALNTAGSRRCIYVSTLIGAMRTAQDDNCTN